MKKLLTLCCSVLSLWSNAQKSSSGSFETWLSLKQAGPAVMAANEHLVAFTQTATDWVNNTYDTKMFKAISVGACISNWITYYVSTDITPFTRQYLQSAPWTNMEMYRKTSPMTTINNAVTPTLIQHGELDRRVPISNAYELYRGLQDRKVPSKLIVYKGFGHGITKPKERLAAVWHNWLWFNHYVFGDKETELPTD